MCVYVYACTCTYIRSLYSCFPASKLPTITMAMDSKVMTLDKLKAKDATQKETPQTTEDVKSFETSGNRLGDQKDVTGDVHPSPKPPSPTGKH